MNANDSGSLAIFEDTLDMLAEMVRALGGAKKVGPVLRPSLPVEQAAQWIRDCLNRERRERFDPEQVVHLLKLARQAGHHAGKHWLDSELGYEQGKPLDPVDEMADLQRKFIAYVEIQAEITKRMERLTRSPLQAVKP